MNHIRSATVYLATDKLQYNAVIRFPIGISNFRPFEFRRSKN
jgi:hypothetical protein